MLFEDLKLKKNPQRRDISLRAHTVPLCVTFWHKTRGEINPQISQNLEYLSP